MHTVHLHTCASITESRLRKANAKAMQFIQILIISVTVVVVAVPEGN